MPPKAATRRGCSLAPRVASATSSGCGVGSEGLAISGGDGMKPAQDASDSAAAPRAARRRTRKRISLMGSFGQFDLLGTRNRDHRSVLALDPSADPDPPAFEPQRIREGGVDALSGPTLNLDLEVLLPAPSEIEIGHAARLAGREHAPLDHGEAADHAVQC